MNEKPDIKSMNITELTEFVTALGEKPFRARQLYQWMHQKLSSSINEMTNLPLAFRETLKRESRYISLKQVQVQVSKEDGTRKYLFLLEDGNVIESVRMRYKFGNSVCISSQAGCRMACRFCASGIGGLVRGLTPSEMLEQIYRIQEDIGERVSHVVVMGTGEPLDNYENLLQFIALLCDDKGLNIGQRNLTVSTCGIVPNMRRLAEEKLQITLALSLHAPSQAKRKELMPVAGTYDMYEVLGACQYYFEQTGRRMTFEYSLLAGVNDGDEDAKALADLLKGMNCHVNLIPVNPVTEHKFRGPEPKRVLSFKNNLEKNGINVTIRREMGRDIDAACGQLRKRYVEGR
ncbi:MAG: 23S rRNA (adenine(2503)-C(2))-methyltransferase RlmN [Lachnospiraceae bacterium]|nr:23S rRNA (adenine(2503)-C(2))-methyltransferase RlmN [Lachnospiraceae bacterium]